MGRKSLGLFVSQVVAEFYVIQVYAGTAEATLSLFLLYVFTAIYIVLGLGLFVSRSGSLRDLLGHTAETVKDAFGTSPSERVT